MSLDLVTVPCLTDNYAFLLHDPASGKTAVVDVPEAAPIRAALAERGWQADMVLLTHHHADHIQGLGIQGLGALDLPEDAEVIGAEADQHRLPPLTQTVREGSRILLGTHEINVIEVPGHTVGHVAYHCADAGVAFTGDSLMALGCGRLFEGTPQQMWESLVALALLPGETRICSGHEYTAQNAKFALSIEPENPDLQARMRDISERRTRMEPTVPSRLSLEMATNPFLRADTDGVRAALGLPDAPAVEVFAELRRRKDNF